MSPALPIILRAKRPVLSRAVAYWNPRVYDPTLDALPDLTGHGLHAVFGSSVGSDTNDPLRLLYAGEKYVYFPGASGNYISTPDSAAVSITGDIDIRAKVALADWTPSAEQTVIGKYNTSANKRSYRLSVSSAGLLLFNVSSDGTAVTSVGSTVSVSATDGQTVWIRVTWRASDGRVQFFTSSDGVTWVQLGANVTAAVGSINDNDAPVELGSSNGGTTVLLTGNLYYAEIRNGIDGTVVAKFDASALTEPYASLVSSTGETWTLNRSTSGRRLAAIGPEYPSVLISDADDYAVATSGINIGTRDFTFTTVKRVHHSNPSGSNEPWALYAGPNNPPTIGANSLYANITTGGELQVVKRSAANGFQGIGFGGGGGYAGFRAAYAGQMGAITVVRRAGKFWIYWNTALLGSHADFATEAIDSTYLAPWPGNSNGGTPWAFAALIMEGLDQEGIRRLIAEMGVAA